MTTERPEKIKVSLDEARKEVEKRRHRVNNANNGDENVTEKQLALKELVDHLIYADDEYLLQLSPIPQNAVFDVCYDVTQRAVLNKERIAKGIPLSKIFYETYLRARRGANQMLARGFTDMAGMQIQSKGDVEPVNLLER
jgi:hypothetical protein